MCAVVRRSRGLQRTACSTVFTRNEGAKGRQTLLVVWPNRTELPYGIIGTEFGTGESGQYGIRYGWAGQNGVRYGTGFLDI